MLKLIKEWFQNYKIRNCKHKNIVIKQLFDSDFLARQCQSCDAIFEVKSIRQGFQNERN